MKEKYEKQDDTDKNSQSYGRACGGGQFRRLWIVYEVI